MQCLYYGKGLFCAMNVVVLWLYVMYYSFFLFQSDAMLAAMLTTATAVSRVTNHGLKLLRLASMAAIMAKDTA